MCLCMCVCVCVCLWIGLCAWVRVCVWARGCVCGCVVVGVRFGTGLCAYVVGWPPHPHTHQHTSARPHVETNRKSCIHPHANPTIHPYTNPHKPTHPTQRHTHTHVHMLPVARVPAGVHWGGVPRVLGQMRGCTRVKFVRSHVNSREIRTKFVCEFTPMNRLQGCRVLAPLVSGAVWAWWMLLGRDLHWMMRNEVGGRILPPQIP